MIKEMQAEDEELGLGTATVPADETAPVASTSRSPSPEPAAASAHDTDAQLAASLHAGLAGLDGAPPSASGSDHSATESEAELVRPKKGKKGGTAVKKNQPPPGAVFDSDEEEAALAARRKGKRGGRTAGPTPLDEVELDGDGGREEDLGGMGGKGKKGRRAKGKGSAKPTPVASGAATPVPPVGEGEAGEGAEEGADAEAGVQPEPEMSKKDKRRVKEAAKKAAAASGTSSVAAGAVDAEFVSLSLPPTGPPDPARSSAFPPREADSVHSPSLLSRAQSCNVCSSAFPSRSKMFDHIKATGHALADGQDVMGFGGKKAGKKGRK